MGVIYKIINHVNNKIYVGRDKHDNPKYMGSGKLINLAFEKYGFENFSKEIIESCDNNLLDEREKFWIKELKSQDKTIGYNIADGGHNDFTMNEYVKSKISKTLKGKYIGTNAYRHGLKLSDEHKLKLCEKAGQMKGKTFDKFYGKERADEIKQKISKAHLGIKLTQSHCKAISKAKKGVPLTEKQHVAISRGMIGHVVTDETKEKLRISNLNKTQKHSIKLECVNKETGEVLQFNNVEHAKREFNCTRYQLLQNKLKGFDVKKLI